MRMLEVECGDMRQVLRTLQANSFDSIVCDPPYELGFAGKAWDKTGIAFDSKAWAEAYRVLKPGAYLVAFGGTRTWHRIAVAIEDAGFQIRDSLAWLYGTGFPKSLNVYKELAQKAVQAAERDVRFVSATYVQAAVYACRECGQVLLSSLPESSTPFDGPAAACSGAEGPSELLLEGRSNVSKGEGELYWCPICTLSNGVFADGAEGRLRCGAPPSDGEEASQTADAHGGCAPHQPQPEGQQAKEPDAVRFERRAQTVRGFGTALKPSFEPVILARKPPIGTVAENLEACGVGGLNIDACRTNQGELISGGGNGKAHNGGKYGSGVTNGERPIVQPHTKGRWPPNVCVDEDVAADLDETNGVHKSAPYKGGPKQKRGQIIDLENIAPGGYSDKGGVSRYFYCAKPSSAERDAGLDHWPLLSGAEATNSKEGQARLNSPRTGAGRGGNRRNPHVTIKPLALMRWLCKLVTPPGGFILDPFAGSGTTGCAAALEGFHFAGIELDPIHTRLAMDRIAYWARSICVDKV